MTAVDPHEGMLGVAREKCDRAVGGADRADDSRGAVAFRRTGLPDLNLRDAGPFDAGPFDAGPFDAAAS